MTIWELDCQEVARHGELADQLLRRLMLSKSPLEARDAILSKFKIVYDEARNAIPSHFDELQARSRYWDELEGVKDVQG